MADEKEVDKLLSPFEKMKVQVANHESVIVLRCSIALVNHNNEDPLGVGALFSKVKKHISITCVDIFKNVLTSKDKLFGSSDNFETVFLKPSKVCLLQEMLASCASHVPKPNHELSSFHATVTEHKFEVKANKNSLDFTNLCGQYFAVDGTFVPKFQRKKHHVGLPFSVPGNLKCKDGDWLLVSMRFSIKANLQFGCEIHTAKVIREVAKEFGKKGKASTITPMTQQTKVSKNVLVHSIFGHILTSTHQQMRMKDVQTFLVSEMHQQLSEEQLFRLFVKFPALFHIHKDSNKGIVSIKKFNLNSVTEYLTLGDNVNVVKKRQLQNVDVPASKGVEMAVKSSRTETIMNVTNLSGLLVLNSGAGGQEGWEVLFKLDPKSENILSMPCSRGSFHNSISRSSQVTFNLQKKLCNKNMTEVKFGIVPGKHKEDGKAGHNTSSKKKAKAQEEPKQASSKRVPSSDLNTLETVLVSRLVFALVSKPAQQLPYDVAKLIDEEIQSDLEEVAYQSLMRSKNLFLCEGSKVELRDGWIGRFLLLGENLIRCPSGLHEEGIPMSLSIPMSNDVCAEVNENPNNQILTMKNIHVKTVPTDNENVRVYMRFPAGQNSEMSMFMECPVSHLCGKTNVNLTLQVRQDLGTPYLIFKLSPNENGNIALQDEMDPHGVNTVDSSWEVQEVNSTSVDTVESNTDADPDSKLPTTEVVVTKLVFALLSKLPHQAQYNVSKLFYENFLGQGKMKDYFSIIQNQKQIFHLQDNKLSLRGDWLRHFVLLGDNMKVSTSQVLWASTSQIPAIEVSKKKSGNQAETHLPQAIAIKNIPVVLHPVSSEDPRHQYVDMKLDSGKKGTIRTFCKRQQLQFNSGTVTLSLHLKSVSKKSCIDFVVSNGKKLDPKVEIKERGTDNRPNRSDKSVSPVNTSPATSGKRVSLPEELAAIQLIFDILSTGPVNRGDLHPRFDVSLEKFPKLWNISQGFVGLASSWVEAMLPLALNVTETETECPSFPTEVEARLTRTQKGHPKLIINNITAVVLFNARRAFKRVFKLSEGGPTFCIGSSANAKYWETPALTLCLSLCLKPVQETSQIILTVTDIKEPRTKPERFQSFEDAVQEDLDDEPDEPFLSSRSPNVITIGGEDVEVETAEDALNVDNSEIGSEAKKEKCTLS